MKFKLDENLGIRTQHIIRNTGHDVSTVREQNIQGCPDHSLFDVCKSENRCLITLDLDFSDITRFPAKGSAGIVVLRTPHNPSPKLLEDLVKQFLKLIETEPLQNNLWIVESNRIRIHQSD